MFIRQHEMKSMYRNVPMALGFMALLLFAGCLVDKGELVDANPPAGYCDSISATYVDTLKTLIDQNCAFSSGCHGTLASNGDFTTFANMQAYGALSTAKIGARVNTNDVNLVMPPGNPMPDSVRQVFQCWISAGFPQQ